jgi:formylglycine-generating enzyme required for sulfatase activity
MRSLFEKYADLKLSRRHFIMLAIGIILAVGVAVLVYGYYKNPQLNKKPVIILSNGIDAPKGMAWVPGGEFLMGSDHKLAQSNERPTHKVQVPGFWIDTTHVTNDQFSKFVKETGYITTAEKIPDWETIKVQLPAGVPRPADAVLVAGAMVFKGTQAPVNLNDYSQWWTYVAGANWNHPTGPQSSIAGKGNHPVVQVSYEDAVAYSKWIGKRLPTEAEWEYAARGGLNQATYVWGDELTLNGIQQANIWDEEQRPFPVVSPKAGGAVGTKPVRTFPRNGYGLFDMTGNAWQWVADWYRADYFAIQAIESGEKLIINPRGPSISFDPYDAGVPLNAPKRVIRGGSFLCNQSYCMSYRPSARRGLDPYNAMSHIGFRLVKDK